MTSLVSNSPQVLENLSFVLASRHREKVLSAVLPGPKTPVQVAQQTGLRLPHVSRALGQLLRADLIRHVGGQRRGKLYSASSLGVAVFGELTEARGDRVVAPMLRGSHFRNYYHWVSSKFGKAAADSVLAYVGLDPASGRCERMVSAPVRPRGA